MFKKGDIVNVYNSTLSGRPFLEGRAVILRSTQVEDQYRVRFVRPTGKSANDLLGDPGYSRKGVDRFVYGGEAQTDPHAFLVRMLVGSCG